MLKCCKLKHGVLNKNHIRLAFVIMLILTICRWDIGNDYANYAKSVPMYANTVESQGGIMKAFNYYDQKIEISYIALSWVFGDFPANYVWVIGSLGLIFQLFVFLSLKRVDGYYWGYLALFITELIFLSWDAVRQGAAIGIILFAVEFIREGKPIKYLISVLAASLFHTSVLIMVPFYLLRYIKVHDFVLIAAIGGMTVLMWLGVLTELMSEVTAYFALFEHYEGYANSTATLAVAESMMYKLRLVLYALFWSGIILFLPKDRMIYKLFITIGACIFLFAMNSMSITRIAWYFLSSVVVGLPIAMNNLKVKYASPKNIHRIATTSIIVAMFFLFSYDVLRDSNTHGCSPYDSIFSTNYQYQKFRPKSY